MLPNFTCLGNSACAEIDYLFFLPIFNYRILHQESILFPHNDVGSSRGFFCCCCETYTVNNSIQKQNVYPLWDIIPQFFIVNWNKKKYFSQGSLQFKGCKEHYLRLLLVARSFCHMMVSSNDGFSPYLKDPHCGLVNG